MANLTGSGHLARWHVERVRLDVVPTRTGDALTPKRPATMSDVSRSDGLLPLQCVTSWPRPHVCVVHLAGELDIATVPAVARYLRDQTARRPTELVLDLGAVTLLSAVAVGLIVDAQHADRGINGRLRLTGVSDNRPVDRVLRLTGLRPLLDIHDDLQTLLDSIPPH
jgi:anti-sigma B factor antagonist